MSLKYLIVNQVASEVREVAYDKNQGIAKLGQANMNPDAVAVWRLHDVARPRFWPKGEL